MFLSVDIGGTFLKYAAFEQDKLIQKGELETNGAQGAENLVANLKKIIGRFSDIEAIGIDTAGLVDSSKGILIRASNLGIYDFPLCDILSAEYGVPVFLENDVNSAALGESYYGNSQEDDSFLFLTYGTGIGGAIVINRELYTGACGIAGELGHIIVHPGGIPCPCGMVGCYERYASTTALVENAHKLDQTVTNGRNLFEKFYAGDPAIKQVVDRWIDEIVLGLVSMVHVFNPSAIVVGGGIMNEDYIVAEINRKLKASVIPTYGIVEVKHAKLGNDAGVYGMLARYHIYQKQ